MYRCFISTHDLTCSFFQLWITPSIKRRFPSFLTPTALFPYIKIFHKYTLSLSLSLSLSHSNIMGVTKLHFQQQLESYTISSKRIAKWNVYDSSFPTKKRKIGGALTTRTVVDVKAKNIFINWCKKLGDAVFRALSQRSNNNLSVFEFDKEKEDHRNPMTRRVVDLKAKGIFVNWCRKHGVNGNFVAKIE
ncbi:hypothetical protein ACB092_04G082800 [Castanea dentata]